MEGRLIELAERRLHARPIDEAEAHAALQWLAAQEQKTFDRLVWEIQTAAHMAGETVETVGKPPPSRRASAGKKIHPRC